MNPRAESGFDVSKALLFVLSISGVLFCFKEKVPQGFDYNYCNPGAVTAITIGLADLNNLYKKVQPYKLGQHLLNFLKPEFLVVSQFEI